MPPTTVVTPRRTGGLVQSPPLTVDTRRASTTAPSTDNDFLDFVRKLIWLALTPVTLPLRFIHHTLTSPLTLSLVLRLILLGFLFLSSAVFSILAVGAFFWSWSTGSSVEVEGWLFYGSKNHRAPHVTVPLPVAKFYEDLRYDVQLELELVRPARGAPEEMGNFMLSLDLKSLRDPQHVVFTAAQPSLPPPPLQSSLLSISLATLPSHLLPPCILPWPFRSLCPSRLLGYGGKPNSKIRERRIKGGFSSPAKGKDVVLLKKELMEGVLLKPSRTPELVVGSAFVSIGREDAFDEGKVGNDAKVRSHEVRTTGWVVVRFVPRPTGVRWLLSSHPLPPLLLLPPVSLSLSLTSSIFACAIITCLRRPKKRRSSSGSRLRSSEQLLRPEKEGGRVAAEDVRAEKQAQTFDAHDRKEREEAERREEEWERLANAQSGPSSASGAKDRLSTVEGSETTVQSTVQSFAPSIESDSETTTSTETIQPTTAGRGFRRNSSGLIVPTGLL